jgi:D-3-phosphoglycerate dehydrogenase / 2-oxoglutarate reductase
MPHVLCLRPIHPEAIELMRAAPGVTVEILDPINPQTLAEALPRAEAVIVRIAPITRQVIAQAPKLRIVARHGVGYDAVDVPALTERGIPLTITPEANAGSVAEHALMLMLAVARRVTGYDANMRKPVWGAQPDLPTFDLAGRTVLLVGFGRIGSRVAKLCAAFGMRVMVRDPIVPANTIRGLGYIPLRSVEEGLAEADIVSLHCPSNETTRGMVDAAFFARMKKGAVLINTARGTLVEEAALEAALRSGHLAAAGIDVFWSEPVEKPIPLLSAPNLIMTPHSAAGTAEGMRRMALSCADSVLACFAGSLDPDVVVNREVLARGNA